MTMSDYSTIVPAPGELKSILRKLNEIAGGHADATVDGHHEITAPTDLVEKFNAANRPVVEEPKPEAPKPRRRAPKKEEEQ